VPAAASTAKEIKVKKTCCKDGPRCKRCPVVWKKLAKTGHAERTGKRTFVVVDVVPKGTLRAARAR
jgi:hypothetical protein